VLNASVDRQTANFVGKTTDASALALYPSVYRRYGYRALMVGVATVLLFLPLDMLLAWTLVPIVVYLCYWLALQQQAPMRTTLLLLNEQQQLRWFPEQGHGLLLRQSLVCDLGVWLYWQDDGGRVRQQWLFADNFTETDFRTLARAIQTLRWQTAR
jgi:hypothetical protein